jgi:hypothetical protein
MNIFGWFRKHASALNGLMAILFVGAFAMPLVLKAADTNAETFFTYVANSWDQKAGERIGVSNLQAPDGNGINLKNDGGATVLSVDDDGGFTASDGAITTLGVTSISGTSANFSGNVTGATFSGDGSGLTNLSAGSNITDGDSNATVTDGSYFQITMDSSVALTVLPTGSVGIGTATPDRALVVNGDASSSGTISATTLSASADISFSGSISGDGSGLSNVVVLTGNQTVNGVKTFGSAPKSSEAADEATELVRFGELGDIHTQDKNNVDIDGGSIDGVTVTNTTLEANNTYKFNYTVITAGTQVSHGGLNLIDTSSAASAFRVTLPDTTAAGRYYPFEDAGRTLATTNAYIDPGDGNTINGSGNSLQLADDGMRIHCFGTGASSYTCNSH